MIIKKGTYPIWESFSLELPEDLDLGSGNIYWLKGDNGSGKSSFISQVLIPLLREQEAEAYIVWMQQQMLRQFYVLKAHAALNQYPVPIRSEKDAGTYLLHDLEQVMLREPHPVIAILDEFASPDKVISRLRLMSQPLLAVFCSHNPVNIAGMREIRFQKLSPTLSKAYEISI